MQQALASAVRRREDTEAVAALDLFVSLDRQAQLTAVALGSKDTHPGT